MAHRLFFYISFALFVAVMLLALLFKLNYLPQPLYEFVALHIGSHGSGPTYPYLQKFEGRWTMSFEPSVNGTDVVRCSSQTGYLAVHNGATEGSLGALADTVNIDASVAADGHLSGRVVRGPDQVGSVDVEVSGANGQGSFRSAADCVGSLKIHKLDPVVDPVVGKLVSFGSAVTLKRYDTTTNPYPGQQLYEGDIIDVPAGTTAYVTLGVLANKVNLEGPTTYVVKPER
jgi:hypothetical protein